MHASPDEQTIEQIAAEHPGWNVWQTRGPDGTPRELMATRRRDLSTAELRAGLARTLPMGFFGDLRKQLAEQAERESTLGGDTP